MVDRTRCKRRRSPSPHAAPGDSQSCPSGSRIKKQAIRGGAPTPLHSAAAAGHTDEVRALIAAGADINAEREAAIDKQWDGRFRNVTPLAMAIAFGHASTAQLLIDAGAELNPVKHPYNWQPLNLLLLAAWQSGSAAVVDVLLRTGRCNVNEEYPRAFSTPLHAAIEAMAAGAAPDASVVRRLLADPGIDVGKVPGYRNGEQGTPLHHAVRKNQPAAVGALLEAKADPNDAKATVDCMYNWRLGMKFDGCLRQARPLDVAACFGAADAVAPLVAAGARVDERCSAGLTPLMLAALMSCRSQAHGDFVATVRALVAAGADINAQRDHANPSLHNTALFYALRYGDGAVCEALFNMGATSNLVPATRDDLIAWAYSSADASIVKKINVMRALGVDLTSTELLHALAKKGFEAAVVALVEAGADATARDEQGHTALRLLLHVKGERGRQRWRGGVSAATVATLIKAGDLDSWGAIPYNFEGLECVLGYLKMHAPRHLRTAFRKLTKNGKKAVRMTLLSVHGLVQGGPGLDTVRFKIMEYALS